MASPVRINPFRTVPWQSNEAREVPLEVGNENNIHTEYVWTTVRRLRSDDGALAPICSGPDAEGRTGIDAIRSALPEEHPQPTGEMREDVQEEPRLHTLKARPEDHAPTVQFDNQLDQALLLVNYIQTITRVFELIDKLEIMTEKLDAWDALDDSGNYDDSDPYYRPDEGGDGYQGNDY